MGAARTPSTPASSKMERTPMSTPGGSRVKEEKIFVTVRVRPLSKKEQALKDQVAWECIDDHTILYTASSQDRSSSPASYTFDRVFGPSCLTETVYEEGAKDVALSALTGINATIFAYGQTSSGKTYTMRGVTESAVNDIYKHIENTPERSFLIKISAMEIYNENVKDLLKPDSGSLRLLDDPEKGTIVEKLEEEIVKDSQHLRHLIGICEALIILYFILIQTVESSLRENSGCVKSFVASLNFVDLAGSERAAQTNANGTRLKEGCHINRSLLTLTTVIRKLSIGKRSGHIPYRDSKLTRILQLSLGGNARTAIICTMSPALSHVEQSRNTLFFATCAKEVTNTAQVNMVVSDKQLVKHLQKEVARLEAELRTPEPSTCSEAILMEKEMKIKKMEMEMEELKRERDLAQLQLDELRKKVGDDQTGWNPFDSAPHRVAKCLTFSGPSPQAGRKGGARNPIRQSSTAPFVLRHEIRKLEQLQRQLGDEANRALEVLQKEVTCHRLGNQNAAETIAKLQAEIREVRAVQSVNKEFEVKDVLHNQEAANLKEEINRLDSQAQEKMKMLPLALSSNINRPHIIKSPCSPHSSSKSVLELEVENRVPESDNLSEKCFSGSEKATPTKSEDGGEISSREGTPGYRRSSSVNMKKMQKMFENAVEENVRSIRAYVTELKERVAKLQYQKQLLVCQVLELEANEAVGDDAEETEENVSDAQNSPDNWPTTFKEQMRQIIQLWDICHVSIIHRTQFYLLFRGDPADQIYIEVELRRLTWLQQHFSEVGDASPAYNGDESVASLSTSTEARERVPVSKGELTTNRRRARAALHQVGVPLEGKQRKLQLVNKLWTDPTDPVHIEESADIVARLVGFCEGGNITKEMFELNFALPTSKKPWLLGWQPISNLLRL
uniref:Kinesin-like protein n=1 Tax=Ananas comosus var. bracteatus TaxID=296719 RepID=A0A6V7QU12_ANACO